MSGKKNSKKLLRMSSGNEVKVLNTKTKQIKTIKQHASRTESVDPSALTECPECGKRYCLGAGRMVGDWVLLDHPLRPVPVCQKCACKLTGVKTYEYTSKKESTHKSFKKGYKASTYRESEQICKFTEPLYNAFVSYTQKDKDGYFHVPNDWIRRETGCRYPTELLALMQKIHYVEVVRGKGNERMIRVLGSENHVPILKRIMEAIEGSVDEKTGFSTITNQKIGKIIGTNSVAGFVDHLIKQGYLEKSYNSKKSNERLLKIKRRYE